MMNFNSKTIVMLRVGAVLNFLLAAGHFAALFLLDKAFQFYEIDGIMNEMASICAALPYLITVALVGGFIVAGIYSLSASGSIRKFPFEKLVISAIFFVFAGRAIMGAISLFINFQTREIVSTIIAAAVTFCYASATKTYIKDFFNKR
ncbi:MAG: hypothetical protein MJY99_08685 [Fibrobacter sp.]|nr:hypothetical protein [Fibrobacter sp.]